MQSQRDPPLPPGKSPRRVTKATTEYTNGNKDSGWEIFPDAGSTFDAVKAHHKKNARLTLDSGLPRREATMGPGGDSRLRTKSPVLGIPARDADVAIACAGPDEKPLGEDGGGVWRLCARYSEAEVSGKLWPNSTWLPGIAERGDRKMGYGCREVRGQTRVLAISWYYPLIVGSPEKLQDENTDGDDGSV
ncbi:hypothetical protein LX36DRAFT_726775 [Colletotrichum falcatum]|nr:hypothetical protein LX36DRAFT_726775 [Colletotrichum falcatum]